VTLRWPILEITELTDRELAALRIEPKRRLSQTRQKQKGSHYEQNYDLLAAADDSRRYRLFVRQSSVHPQAFSVGLILLLPHSEDLILCRYNGGSHTHANRLEDERLPAQPHVHVTTERYLQHGLYAEAYATLTPEYHSVDGALHCLVTDCNVSGIPTTPDQPRLL
jgi:hypothetical protein